MIFGCSTVHDNNTSEYLTFKQRIGIGQPHIFAGKYLWVFTGKDRVEIFNGEEHHLLLFKDLPTFPCPDKPKTEPSGDPKSGAIDELLYNQNVYFDPKCRPFFNRIFTGGSFGSIMVGMRVQHEKVILELDRKTYIFNADGSLISFNRRHFINDGPWGKWGWEVKNDELWFNGEKQQGDKFAFSRRWVAIYSRKKRVLTMKGAKSGKTKATFEIKDNTTRDYQLSKEKGFRLYQSQGGFYIEKDEHPYQWFGKKVIDLQTTDDLFCYVSEEKKKCIENTRHELKRIWENKYYLLVRGKWAETYVLPK